MKKIYSRLSILIAICIVVSALCSCDLFTTDEDKFYLEGNKLKWIDLEKTGPDVVVPEKVGDDVIYNIYFADWWAAGIESLDVSNLKELKHFILWLFQVGDRSKLKRLDFSKNKKLKSVSVNDAKALKEIVFSESCETIGISNTAVKEVDLKELKKLDSFTYCDGPLEELDVSNNPNLTNIWAINTNVKSIDVSNNPNLKYIWVSEGTEIIGNTNAQITYLDKEDSESLKDD